MTPPSKTGPFEIRLDHLQLSSAGSVEGEIAFRMNADWFPGFDWSDLPVPVVLGLLEAVTRESNDAAIVHFLDGPFLVTLQKHRSTAWRLVGTRTHRV